MVLEGNLKSTQVTLYLNDIIHNYLLEFVPGWLIWNDGNVGHTLYNNVEQLLNEVCLHVLDQMFELTLTDVKSAAIVSSDKDPDRMSWMYYHR